LTRYLDSSAIIKLYVDEPGSADVRAQVSTADVIATSTVAYAEVRAAIARLRRERRISRSAATACLDQLNRDWQTFMTIDVSDALCREAGALADRLNLRGFDAIHLATFARLLERIVDEVEFMAFDKRLNAAARKLSDD
jgi:hypothetical protein